MASTNSSIKTNTGINSNNLMQNLKKSSVDMSKNTGIVILVIVVLILIILIIIYIYRIFSSSGLKKIDLIDKVISLEQRGSLPYSIPSSKMSVTTRGQEFTYGFWLYLSDVYENTIEHKVLFTRGNTNKSTSAIDSNANPVVLLDKGTNTMYVALSTTATPQSSAISVNSITVPGSDANFMVGKVDYVPLQRWVHYCIVVKDSSLMLFMDGELYSITTTADIKTTTSVRPIIKGNNGDVIIGNPSSPIKGFMAKFQFFNYALSSSQIQDVYKAGPVNKSMLAYIGLGNYGLRTPVYNIDDSS